MKLLFVIFTVFLGYIGILNSGCKGACGSEINLHKVIEEGSYPKEILFFTQGKDTLNFYIKIREHQNQNGIFMGVDVNYVFSSVQCDSDSSTFIRGHKPFDNYKSVGYKQQLQLLNRILGCVTNEFIKDTEKTIYLDYHMIASGQAVVDITNDYISGATRGYSKLMNILDTCRLRKDIDNLLSAYRMKTQQIGIVESLYGFVGKNSFTEINCDYSHVNLPDSILEFYTFLRISKIQTK